MLDNDDAETYCQLEQSVKKRSTCLIGESGKHAMITKLFSNNDYMVENFDVFTLCYQSDILTSQHAAKHLDYLLNKLCYRMNNLTGSKRRYGSDGSKSHTLGIIYIRNFDNICDIFAEGSTHLFPLMIKSFGQRLPTDIRIMATSRSRPSNTFFNCVEISRYEEQKISTGEHALLGMEQILSELEAFIMFPITHRSSLLPKRGAVICGQSGTGKTSIAAWMQQYLGQKCQYIDVAASTTASVLHRLTTVPQHVSSVMFIDNADSLFSSLITRKAFVEILDGQKHVSFVVACHNNEVIPNYFLKKDRLGLSYTISLPNPPEIKIMLMKGLCEHPELSEELLSYMVENIGACTPRDIQIMCKKFLTDRSNIELKDLFYSERVYGKKRPTNASCCYDSRYML